MPYVAQKPAPEEIIDLTSTARATKRPRKDEEEAPDALTVGPASMTSAVKQVGEDKDVKKKRKKKRKNVKIKVTQHPVDPGEDDVHYWAQCTKCGKWRQWCPEDMEEPDDDWECKNAPYMNCDEKELKDPVCAGCKAYSFDGPSFDHETVDESCGDCGNGSICQSCADNCGYSEVGG